MAKRFYDTNLINQEWYMELSPKHKALYIHLLCSCDIAGVFEVNYRIMSAFVNDKITEEDVFGAFGNRVKPLMMNNGTKGIIVDFVSFQCGGELNCRVKAHMSIIRRLNELHLDPEDLNEMANHKFVVNDLLKQAMVSAIEEKHNEEKIQKRIYKDHNELMFERFWANYPRHDSKKIAKTKFISIMNKAKDKEKLLQDMIASISVSKQSKQWAENGGQFIPMPSTWLNQERWNDTGIVKEENNKQTTTLASLMAKSFSI